MNITWDAEKYTADFAFVHRLGGGVAELLELAPGSSVLDLGCGNGALTAELREKGLDAFGMDASEELLRVARREHPDIRFIHGDATDFALEEPVDAFFSNAVFHWIEKRRQPELLRCVHAALRPGGQFAFEFGGRGNNALIHAGLNKVFEKYGFTYNMPFFFPSVAEYASLLEEAGFDVRFAALFDRPTRLSGENGLADWIGMFVKTPLEAVPRELREPMIRETAETLRSELYRDGAWYADYVRLRMKAVKA